MRAEADDEDNDEQEDDESAFVFWCWTPPRPRPVSGPQWTITSSDPSSSSTASSRHVLPHAEASAQSMRSEDWKLGTVRSRTCWSKCCMLAECLSVFLRVEVVIPP